MTISGYCSRLGSLTFAAERHDQEIRHRDAVIRHQLLGQRLVARQRQAARIASRVRHLQQLEIADDVLIEHDDVVERLHQVEGDGRLELVHRLLDGRQIVVHADHADLVAEHLQRADDVVLHAPFGGFRRRLVDFLVGRLEALVHEGEHALRFHSAILWRPLCRKFMTCTVSSTVNSCEVVVFRRRDTELQFAAADDDVLEHLVDRVLVNAGPVGDDLADLAAVAADELRGGHVAWNAPAHRRTACADRGRRTRGDRRRGGGASSCSDSAGCG